MGSPTPCKQPAASAPLGHDVTGQPHPAGSGRGAGGQRWPRPVALGDLHLRRRRPQGGSRSPQSVQRKPARLGWGAPLFCSASARITVDPPPGGSSWDPLSPLHQPCFPRAGEGARARLRAWGGAQPAGRAVPGRAGPATAADTRLLPPRLRRALQRRPGRAGGRGGAGRGSHRPQSRSRSVCERRRRRRRVSGGGERGPGPWPGAACSGWRRRRPRELRPAWAAGPGGGRWPGGTASRLTAPRARARARREPRAGAAPRPRPRSAPRPPPRPRGGRGS